MSTRGKVRDACHRHIQWSRTRRKCNREQPMKIHFLSQKIITCYRYGNILPNQLHSKIEFDVALICLAGYLARRCEALLEKWHAQ